jgi:ketosteroid isomerase-like protein
MTSDDDVRQAVLALENERYAAMLAADADALDRLLSSRLVYVHSTGGRDTKAEYLDRVRSGFFVYETIDHPVDQIIVAGGAAVVVGAMDARVQRDGKLVDLRNSVCAVWADEDGTWRLVTFAPTPQPAS